MHSRDPGILSAALMCKERIRIERPALAINS